MKARWLIITVLLAFPFAFAFFLREARLSEKRAAKPALVVAPLRTPATSVVESTPPAPEPILEEKPAPPAEPSETTLSTTDIPLSPPPIENRESKIENSSDSALLLEGTVIKESDALVYESDAKLQLPNNLFLSSPTGVMVSDEQQKIFAGDMQLLTKQQTISANEAVLTLQPGGSSVLTSKTLSIASNDNSAPPMEIKGDNITVTIPAKKPQTPPLVPSLPPGATDLAPLDSAR